MGRKTTGFVIEQTAGEGWWRKGKKGGMEQRTNNRGFIKESFFWFPLVPWEQGGPRIRIGGYFGEKTVKGQTLGSRERAGLDFKTPRNL